MERLKVFDFKNSDFVLPDEFYASIIPISKKTRDEWSEKDIYNLKKIKRSTRNAARKSWAEKRGRILNRIEKACGGYDGAIPRVCLHELEQLAKGGITIIIDSPSPTK